MVTFVNVENGSGFPESVATTVSMYVTFWHVKEEETSIECYQKDNSCVDQMLVWQQRLMFIVLCSPLWHHL